MVTIPSRTAPGRANFYPGAFSPTSGEILIIAGCVTPAIVGVGLALEGGGFHITSWGLGALAVLTALGAAALVRRTAPWSRLAVLAVAGWASLAAWQGLSALWAEEAWSAALTMDRTILYTAALALGATCARRPRHLRLMGDASLVAAAIVAAVGVGARLLPDLVPGDEGARLATPVTYWNSLGALMAFGGVLAVATAGHPTRSRRIRAAAGALCPLPLLALLLTASRGAVAVLGIGLVLLLVLAAGRLQSAVAMAGIGVLCTPLLLVVNREPALSAASGVLPPHGAVGAHAFVLLVVTMAACAALGAGASRIAAATRSWATPRRLAALAGALVLGGGLLAGSHRDHRAEGAPVAAPSGVALSPQPESVVDRGCGACGRRVRRDSGRTRGVPPRDDPNPVWRERSARPAPRDRRIQAEPSAADRLTGGGGLGRGPLWRVAVGEFRSAPVAGTGAGDFRFAWARERRDGSPADNAHSLYLETLGESGLIGLLLLLVAPGCAVAAVASTAVRRREGLASRDRAVALVAASTLGLHMAFDWDWQLPGVALPAVALLGGAIGASGSRRSSGRLTSRVRRSMAALAWIAAVVLVATPLWSATLVDRGNAQVARGEAADALGSLRLADLPVAANPAAAILRGTTLARLGRREESDRAFAEASDRSPREWRIYTAWAIEKARAGQVASAERLILRARRLNPAEFAILRTGARVALVDATRRAAAGDLRGALRASRQADAQDPQSAAPPNLEAKILARLNRPAESDAAFRRALGRDQDNWSVMADFAAALLRRGGPGDFEAARVLIEQARRIKGGEERLERLAARAGLPP